MEFNPFIGWIIIVAIPLVAAIGFIIYEYKNRQAYKTINICKICNKSGKTIFIKTTSYEALSMASLRETVYEGEMCLDCAAIINKETLKKSIAKGVNIIFLWLLPVLLGNYFLIKYQIANAEK